MPRERGNLKEVWKSIVDIWKVAQRDKYDCPDQPKKTAEGHLVVCVEELNRIAAICHSFFWRDHPSIVEVESAFSRCQARYYSALADLRKCDDALFYHHLEDLRRVEQYVAAVRQVTGELLNQKQSAVAGIEASKKRDLCQNKRIFSSELTANRKGAVRTVPATLDTLKSIGSITDRKLN